MSTVHLLRNGEWRACDGVSCDTELCLGVSLEEARALPRPMLEALIATVEPSKPQHFVRHNPYRSRDGRMVFRNSQVTEWWEDGERLHRDYGLPARVWDTGVVEYWEHGSFLYAVGMDPDEMAANR